MPSGELLLSFSLKRNWRELFSLERPQGDIASLHGIRFLNSLMLIVAHKSMATFFVPYMNRTHMAEVRCAPPIPPLPPPPFVRIVLIVKSALLRFSMQFLGKPWTVIGRAASLYTDPFIMLSGMLTAYSFVGKLNKTGNLNIKSEYLSRLLRYLISQTRYIRYIGSFLYTHARTHVFI